MTHELDTNMDFCGSGPTGKSGLIVLLLEWFAGIATIAIVVALFMPSVRNARPAARRVQCANNLKQIGLALLNYRNDYKCLPPAYTVDGNGMPLHSWRTLILPYLDHVALYSSIDLAKPWNHPANALAYEKSVLAYRCPEATGDQNLTTYLAVVTPNSCFRPTKSALYSEITDGPDKTLAVIEVNSSQAVHWMSPMDADEQIVLGTGIDYKAAHAHGMQSLLFDGTVQFLEEKASPAERLALISIAGKD